MPRRASEALLPWRGFVPAGIRPGSGRAATAARGVFRTPADG